MNRSLNSMSEHHIPQVQIIYLADTPELVPLLAEWHHHQWRHLTGARTLEQRKTHLVHHLQRNAIPTTFVAWQKGQPLGSASLVANDMAVLPEWIPWLANVFVLPEHRRQGIGAMLVQRVAAEAANLGYPRLYLYTQNQIHLYESLGWHVSHQRPYRGYDMTVMARDLIVNPPLAVEEPLPTPAHSTTI
jgi:GNAT superfamily N-acetyltransferase